MNTDKSFKLLTLGFVKTLCREIGVTVNRTQAGGIRVALVGSKPGEGYYATDLDDALDTARAMVHQNRSFN